jgi:Bacterial Ig-like domain (group 2)
MRNFLFGLPLALLGTFALTACPSAPTTTSSVTVTGPASQKLKIGAPTAFTAVAQDSTGGALSGKTITWTSSDPSVASVDATGKVTAQRFGTVTISASTEGKTGVSAVLVTYGLQLNMGTLNTSEKYVNYTSGFKDANGQTVGQTPSDVPSATVTKPDSSTFTVPVSGDFNYSQAEKIGSFPSGVYTASFTKDGEVYTDQYSFDASRLIPNFTVTSFTATTTTASVQWPSVPGAIAYDAYLVNETKNETVNFSTRRVDAPTTTISWTGLSLPKGNIIRVYVSAANYAFPNVGLLYDQSEASLTAVVP